MNKSSKKILFFFNHPASADLALIEKGEMPSERLYGLFELRKMGWKASACDDRFVGFFPKIAAFARHYGFNLINFRSLLRALQHDTIVVKDDFSLLLSLVALIFRKKIVYLDSLFFIPRNPIRKLNLWINLKVAPLIVSYSNFQVELWSQTFGIPRSKFQVVPYTIDYPFYSKATASSGKPEPYILSIGRDLGRDFDLLVKAATAAGMRVKLITLPYLIPQSAKDSDNVDVLQRVSYPELFRLYANATMVVVPLKSGIQYPSGIRAVMEALAVGKATIATRTEILMEYFPEGDDTLIYVDPGNVSELAKAIQRLSADARLRQELAQRGRSVVARNYEMNAFIGPLLKILELRPTDHN